MLAQDFATIDLKFLGPKPAAEDRECVAKEETAIYALGAMVAMLASRGQRVRH